MAYGPIWIKVANVDCTGSALRFPDHSRRIFIVSERYELGVSQVIAPGPLQELDAGN
jgi:hypothetical protein